MGFAVGCIRESWRPRAAESPREKKVFWETAIGVLWGASIVFKGVIVPEGDQIQLLISLSDMYTGNDQMKVKLVGTLECLAQHFHSINANRVRPSFPLWLIRP
jgi:hypothetical protein